MLGLWLKLRSSMMITRLANWFGGFTHLSQKWSAPIDRDELLKRIFPK
jgi:hypothetical protein